MRRHLFPLVFLLLPAAASAQAALYPNEFHLSDVKLLESPFRNAMDLNITTLLSYDTDRLLAPYLKSAGLTPKAESFPNWDGLDGHVGGHYLSALAIHYAATSDPRLKQRLEYVLDEFSRCAAARPDGYLGGVPGGETLWAAIRKGETGKIWDYWVPWYNLHKTYAGLRDAWVYTGSERARDMFLRFCDWGIETLSPLSDSQMEEMLANEFGGMDEVFADAYAMTSDTKYLDAARRFTHHSLFDPLARGEDRLDNLHANTQVPKVVGYQRIAELGGDPDYLDAARFFWDTVTSGRSLSIGGNSRREHFPSAADAKSYVDDREGPESCNTNNMLKLTEGLFRLSPEARYADFYERALFNHILSTQHPDHGGYVYFTSARPGHYRVYSQPNSAMWCCVGTGMENHGKYGQFIYTHSADSLWINLFIPSELTWKEKGVTITQQTGFPEEEATELHLSMAAPTRFALKLRHPGWCASPALTVNGEKIELTSSPSSYILLDREWHDGDIVSLSLPMHVELEELNYLPDYVSILRGPIVLGARLESDLPLTGLLADDNRWAHIAGGPLMSVFDTPLLIGSRRHILSCLNNMKPVEGASLSYTVPGLFPEQFAGLKLEPFYRIHDSRYMLYWLSMTPERYDSWQANARRDEQLRLALDTRTVDAVNTGEQQPEADHFMDCRNSTAGNFNGEPWRDASDGGHISYTLRTESRTDLSLRLRLWSAETGQRDFDLLVDDTPVSLSTINLPEGDNEAPADSPAFIEKEYPIPSELTAGKTSIKVTFRPHPRNMTPSIYYLRLLHP